MLTRRHHRGSRSGAALLWSLLISFVMITSSFVFASLGRSSHNLARVHLGKAQAQALANAATNHALEDVQQALDAGVDPPGTGEVTLDGTVVDYTITRTAPPTVVESDSGLSSFVSTYRIEAIARVGNHQVRSRRLVQGIQTPLFQFAMFWENDLEFSYPATMDITGPIHTNSKLYVRSNRQLTFNTNYVGAVGGYFGRSARTESPGGSVDPHVRRWVADPTDGSEIEEYFDLYTHSRLNSWGIPNTSGYDSSFPGYDGDGDGDMYESGDYLPFGPGASEYTSEPDFYAGEGDGQTLQTNEHGLEPVVVPTVDSLEMYTEVSGGDHVWDGDAGEYVSAPAGTGTHTKGAYHANADLSIISKEDGSWRAYTANGMDVTSDLVDAITATDIYDARQAAGNGQRLQITSIDVEELNESGRFPANGLLFVGGYGAGTGTDALGFELRNGEELEGDLTVASPNSLYVRGDFNTDDKKSASVIADAVNVLSNSWNNSKDPGELPYASHTTYNMSVVTGDVEEVGGTFQGSCMNVLRRHERWSYRNEYVNGSIVCPFRSQYATGDYSNKGDYFRPPRRYWNYDQDLMDMDNLPPFTPMSVQVSDVVAW